MSPDRFRDTLTGPAPPDTLTPELKALWLCARGQWAEAHHVVQSIDSPAAAWVHAYLHREEGDLSNAAYWYRRAGRSVGSGSLRDEWQSILDELLDGS